MSAPVVLDVTHDPSLRSWVASAGEGSDFPLQNLPFGVVAPRAGGAPRGVVRIGDEVLDLSGLAIAGLLEDEALAAAKAAGEGSLNALFALGAGPRRALRAALHGLLVEGSPAREQVAALLTPVAEVDVLLPSAIGDYTDFYVGIHHAVNVGSIFRPDNPLLPNYKWVPIGYHGRASSIGVSGGTVVRPLGQTKRPDADAPAFVPTQRLDIELELGIWIGQGNELGEPIALDDAEDHVAGFCLLNDWSARDVQAWEYQPLGPFLAKNFASTVSAWVITPEALEPYRTPWNRPAADPAPLPHLDSAAHRRSCGFDIDLEVHLVTARMRAAGEEPVLVSSSSTRHMYWSVAQMITHHTSNGCNLRPGDLFGSGTISGPTPGSEGSFLELTRGGTEPFALPNGEKRTFLLDGDEVVLRARAHREGAAPIGFGECRAAISPAPGGAR
ncbi:fumarylacetoacetase [Lentzea terrae]|uniref:fumarylacetoacetase n=1 Tax=Lentzea terrae TaxID=2200761 RepID=UPI000DD2DAA2|nr:fumarylacetoacetase [Lentzea terrae]